MTNFNKFVLLAALGTVLGSEALLTNPVSTKATNLNKVNPAG